MTKLTIRIAAPRAPFKVDLHTILQHQDIHDFIDWVQKFNSVHVGQSAELDRDMDSLNQHEQMLFEKLLTENATLLAKTFPGQEIFGGHGSSHGLPYPLAPSYLALNNIRVPADYICQAGLAELLDDYFGLCYNPKRAKEISDHSAMNGAMNDKLSTNGLFCKFTG